MMDTVRTWPPAVFRGEWAGVGRHLGGWPQVADPTFFVRMVPMLDGGDDVGMVLSPQCFWNLNQGGDIFNHTNIHFWEYMQPGAAHGPKVPPRYSVPSSSWAAH